MSNNTGQIIQVVGVVVDAEFQKESLPAIYDALTVQHGEGKIVLEVAQHLSETSVRSSYTSSRS